MTADEILASIEDCDEVYMEIGAYVIAREEIDEEHWGDWAVKKFKDNAWVRTDYFSMLIAALEYALKDGKP